MSLITRCPSCLTSFQVTQSQLVQASGWVRCGRCDQIFDGATHVIENTGPNVPTLGPSITDHRPSTAPQPPHTGSEASGPGPRLTAPGLGLRTPTPVFVEPVMSPPAPSGILDHVVPAAASDDGPAEPTLDPVRPPVSPPSSTDPISGPADRVDTGAGERQESSLPVEPSLAPHAEAPSEPETDDPPAQEPDHAPADPILPDEIPTAPEPPNFAPESTAASLIPIDAPRTAEPEPEAATPDREWPGIADETDVGDMAPFRKARRIPPPSLRPSRPPPIRPNPRSLRMHGGGRSGITGRCESVSGCWCCCSA